jgi:succinate-acetate transporter protein
MYLLIGGGPDCHHNGAAGGDAADFALSIGNTNVWGPGADAALALALVYGRGVQILAGMWAFVRKNTFGALAFSSYGAFWIAYYVFVELVAPGIEPTDAPVAVGVFLLGWTIFTFYMTIPSFESAVRWPRCSCC